MIFGISKLRYSETMKIDYYFNFFYWIYTDLTWLFYQGFIVIINIYNNYVDFKLWYDVSLRDYSGYSGDNIKNEYFNCCDEMVMSACRPLVITTITIQYIIR